MSILKNVKYEVCATCYAGPDGAWYVRSITPSGDYQGEYACDHFPTRELADANCECMNAMVAKVARLRSHRDEATK